MNEKVKQTKIIFYFFKHANWFTRKKRLHTLKVIYDTLRYHLLRYAPHATVVSRSTLRYSV